MLISAIPMNKIAGFRYCCCLVLFCFVLFLFLFLFFVCLFVCFSAFDLFDSCMIFGQAECVIFTLR